MKLKSKKSAEPNAEKTAPAFTDLRQVMDYTKPLTIFFSGVEYESYLDILYNLGIRNFLMSYEYLKGKGSSVFKKYSDIRLFIDSGAYTYQNDPQYESYTIEQWEEQIKTYLNWAKKHKDSIFAIADLDLQYLPNVGYETVYEWRKKYFEPFMLETGVPVCFIYHDDGLDYWEYMCKRYPYVGLSLVIDKADNGEEQLREMFRIAEKYNALCQGMASTNTRLLVDYPFYTVDSTTWNVGLKYGEISVWTGTKMTRVKKEDFETKAFPAIQQYDIPFDFDLIREEDKTEMIRVNAYAFVQAEKYVNERLKSRMYWFKAHTVKVDVDNLPEDFFPSADLLKNPNTEEIKAYAKAMNINPECDVVVDLVTGMTVFLNWDNEEYSSLKQEYLDNNAFLIEDLHDTFVNRIVPDLDTKISDIIGFFKECLSGENDKLLQFGTNFDRTVRERDSYIEEEEEELVDVDEAVIRERVHDLIPTSGEDTTDLDNLDREIFKKAEIVPTFDERGKFVKGQMVARKPKKMYSKKYPKFACDTCYAAAKCAEYKAGYVCAYQKMFTRFDTRNMADIIQAIQGMAEHNLARMQKSMVMEIINGTVDPQVTAFIDQNTRLMTLLKQMYECGSAEVLRQTKVVRADGSREETVQVTNPQSGGILEKLFSNIGGNKADDTTTDEVVVETEEPKKKNARYEQTEDDD